MGIIRNYFISNRYMVQVVLLGILILMLQIPISSIEELIVERQMTKDSATEEVRQLAGGQQRISGPFIAIPYTRTYIDKSGTSSSTTTGTVVIAPDQVTIESEATTEERYRGLFSIPTYQLALTIKGDFQQDKLPQQPRAVLETPIQNRDDATFTVQKSEQKEEFRDQFDYAHAVLTVGVSDPKNILDASDLVWNNAPIRFEAGTQSFLPLGIHAKLPIQAPSPTQAQEKLQFSFRLVLSGSGACTILPSGKETTVDMKSQWPSPSFGGSYLPTTRTVSDEGFSAHWNISPLGREIPEIDYAPSTTSLEKSALSVQFISPVDPHRMTYRAIKYELLIIFLTFACFYLFEVFAEIRIHPMQYLLTGSALVLFYLLLLSLSEHVGFELAYLIAALAALGLVCGYSMAVLSDKKRAWIVTTLLGGLYGFFYTLLREEEYALLMGSIGLACALATAMYMTRRINWYALAGSKA